MFIDGIYNKVLFYSIIVNSYSVYKPKPILKRMRE